MASDYKWLEVRHGETFEQYRDRVLSTAIADDVSDVKFFPVALTEEEVRERYYPEQGAGDRVRSD